MTSKRRPLARTLVSLTALPAILGAAAAPAHFGSGAPAPQAVRPGGPVGRLETYIPRPMTAEQIERWAATLLLPAELRPEFERLGEAYTACIEQILATRGAQLEQQSIEAVASGSAAGPDRAAATLRFAELHEETIVALAGCERQFADGVRALDLSESSGALVEELAARREHRFLMESLGVPCDRRARSSALLAIEDRCQEFELHAIVRDQLVQHLRDVNPLLVAARRAGARSKGATAMLLSAILGGIDRSRVAGLVRAGETLEEARTRAFEPVRELHRRIGERNEAFIEQLSSGGSAELGRCVRAAWRAACFPEVHPDPYALDWAFELALAAEVDPSTRTAILLLRDRRNEEIGRIEAAWRERLWRFELDNWLMSVAEDVELHRMELEAFPHRRREIEGRFANELDAIVPDEVREALRRGPAGGFRRHPGRAPSGGATPAP